LDRDDLGAIDIDPAEDLPKCVLVQFGLECGG